MPTQVPGANARYQALQSLGESIAKIGRTAADIYLTQAEKEQDEQAKIAIVEYGQFRDQARNAFFRSLEEDPPVDMADAMARYEQFYTGGDETDANANGLYQQTQRFLKGKSKRVQKAVTQLFDDKRIADQDLLAMQEIRKQQAVRVGDSVTAGRERLTAKMQDLTPEALTRFNNVDPTERRNQIATELQETIAPALDDLSPGLRAQAEERLRSTVESTAGQYFSAIENFQESKLRAFYVNEEDRILRSPGGRDERLGELEDMLTAMSSENLITPEQAANDLIKYGQAIDSGDIKTLRDSGDIAVVAGLLESLRDDEESFPSLTTNERAREIELTRSRLETLQDRATRQVRSNLVLTVSAILDSNLEPKDRAQLESTTALEAQLANIPDETTKQVFRGLHSYAKDSYRTISNLGERSKAELIQAEEDLTPPRFIGGALNEDFSLFDAIYKNSVGQINAVRKQRESNGASFYQRPEGTSGLDYANLQGKIATQLRYYGYQNPENLKPRELRGLWQANAVRLFSDQEVAEEKARYDQLTTGAEKNAYMIDLERRSGTLAPLVSAELARKHAADGGIGLPYHAQLYKEVSNPAVLENLHAAEQNSEVNRRQVRDRFGGANETLQNVRTEMLANDAILDFFDSFKSDPGATPVVNNLSEFMVDYILEMGNRPNVTLDDAVDMAARHLVEENYSFLQSNGETAPLLIRTELLDGLPAGSAETALTVYTENLFAERKQGLVDLAGSDDLWTWTAKGDGSGIELLLFNQERAQFVTSGVVLPFNELRIITEKHMNGDADLFLSDQAKQQVNAILDETFGPVERPAAPIEEAAPAMATDRRSRALRKEAEPKPPPEEPVAPPPDQDLLAAQSFLSRARDFEPSVTGTDQMVVVERLIEGADIIQQKLQVLGPPKTATEKRSREKLMRELRLLETQLDLIQGNTASKEQIRNLVGDKPEVDPETRKMLEDLLNRRK
jgi:hypothetical protein